MVWCMTRPSPTTWITCFEEKQLSVESPTQLLSLRARVFCCEAHTLKMMGVYHHQCVGRFVFNSTSTMYLKARAPFYHTLGYQRGRYNIVHVPYVVQPNQNPQSNAYIMRLVWNGIHTSFIIYCWP
mgnify:CR=1 FL=1